MSVSLEAPFTIAELEREPRLNDSEYRALEPIVNDVASQEWKSSTLFEIDDVAQAIWLHMVENWKHYDGKDADLVAHQARRAARKFCEKQRTEYMYAMGAFIYTPAIVRQYLDETVFVEPADATDVDARADLTEAFGKLPRAQKAAVYKRYALKEHLDTDAEKMAESRAVASMTHRLNTGLRLQAEVLP